MTVAEDRARIEAMLERQFGPGWRELAIVAPLGVIWLRDLPDEAGPAPAEPRAHGLFQVLPPPAPFRPRSPKSQLEFVVKAWRTYR